MIRRGVSEDFLIESFPVFVIDDLRIGWVVQRLLQLLFDVVGAAPHPFDGQERLDVSGGRSVPLLTASSIHKSIEIIVQLKAKCGHGLFLSDFYFQRLNLVYAVTPSNFFTRSSIFVSTSKSLG